MSDYDWEEHLERVQMMAEGNSKWDLSPNDREALGAVLERVDALANSAFFGVGLPFDRAQRDYRAAHDGKSPASTEQFVLWLIHRYEQVEADRGRDRRKLEQIIPPHVGEWAKAIGLEPGMSPNAPLIVMLRGLAHLWRGHPMGDPCQTCGDAGVVCCAGDEATDQMPFGIGPVKVCPDCQDRRKA